MSSDRLWSDGHSLAYRFGQSGLTVGAVEMQLILKKKSLQEFKPQIVFPTCILPTCEHRKLLSKDWQPCFLAWLPDASWYFARTLAGTSA